MRIVIMADGRGSRWENHLGIPKHFVPIKGEKLIGRTVRLLRNLQTEQYLEIIVTSHDSRYEFDGCTRYEPQNNRYEIDRFTEELIEDDMCFLYGDTYYSEQSIEAIMKTEAEDLLFFGNRRSIVAVKVKDSELFRAHICKVKEHRFSGREEERHAGWQVYRSFTGQAFTGLLKIKDKFVFVDDLTQDIDTPLDYELIEK